jgi:hypothetical protein
VQAVVETVTGNAEALEIGALHGGHPMGAGDGGPDPDQPTGGHPAG